MLYFDVLKDSCRIENLWGKLELFFFRGVKVSLFFGLEMGLLYMSSMHLTLTYPLELTTCRAGQSEAT